MEIVIKLCEADKPNSRGIVYPKGVIDSIVANFKPCLGEADYPEGLDVSLDRVSHEVTDLYIENGSLMAKVKVLDTPMGKILKTLVDATDNKVSFGMVGTGTPVEPNVRPDDFELRQIHSILEPAKPHE